MTKEENKSCVLWKSISAIALILAVIFSTLAYQNSKKALQIIKNKQTADLKPSIRLFIKGEGVDRKAILSNDGVVSAINVFVSHTITKVAKAKGAALGEVMPESAVPGGGLWDAVSMLKPSETITKEFWYDSLADPMWCYVHKFTIIYSRESDLNQFTKEVLFFVDDGKIYNHAGFKKHKAYDAVIDNYFAFMNKRNAVNDSDVLVQAEYDEEGRKTAEIDADGNRVEYAYNQDGSLAAIKDAVGHVHDLAYDDYGRIKAISNPEDTQNAYEYDTHGRMLGRE